MQDYTEILKGNIVHRGEGEPIAGATVEVYDKDLLSSDHLGTAHTDDTGHFQLSFKWSDYKQSIFEGRPDIFFKVTDPGTGQAMKSEVFSEVKGLLDDDDVETMDLGQIEVA